jgi:hypothetical protein
VLRAAHSAPTQFIAELKRSAKIWPSSVAAGFSRMKNKYSVKRPIIAAAIFSCLFGGLFAGGVRGRFGEQAASMDFGAAIIFILLLAICSFVFLYLLQFIGLEINWSGGREAPKNVPEIEAQKNKQSRRIAKKQKL